MNLKILFILISIVIIVVIIKKIFPNAIKEYIHFKTKVDEQNKILDQVPVCIMITDLNNTITYVNNKLCTLSGYDKEYLIGKSPSILKSENKSVTNYKELWETLNADKEWEGQFLNKKKNGDLYWEKAIISSIYNSKGQKDHYLSITEDITEKVQIKKEKKLLQEELSQSQRLKSVGLLVGGIAHDFNNELCGIMSAAQLLTNPKRVPDEESRKFAEIILKSSKRSADLTSKLLSFSKRKNRGVSLISLREVLNDTIEILKPTTNRYIEIILNVDCSNDKIVGNLAEIHSTLINLGINASHAIADIGSITYTLKNIIVDEQYIEKNQSKILPGMYALIEVLDTGKGIPIEIIDNIFDPFFTTKGKSVGTGLGLSSSKRIIEEHNGEIKVKSIINKGTTFSILLPLDIN